MSKSVIGYWTIRGVNLL